MIETASARGDWPLRPWLLGIMLGLAGLLIHLVGAGDGPGTKDAWRAAAGAFLFFGPLAFALSVERDRWKPPLAFAAGVGLVMAGLAWRAVWGGDAYADPQYGFMAGVIATGLALPLFQAGFHRTRFATPYAEVHGQAWSDAILAGGALVFMGAAWAMIALLAELFHLLKIDLLRDLIGKDWFGWTWSGAAFGAGLGVLRNELKILGTLQNVAMAVLSILAVPLALGLALFLVAMAISGPDVLWQATRSATPVLLTCAAGAWVLANAVLRDDDAAMSGNRLLRAAGLVLALCLLPLTVFAAVSLGTRVAQHGLSPERLWGLIAIGVACAYGLAWLVAVVGGWKGGAWRGRLRQANLHLAAAVSLVALLLALPILDFGAISARQQVARLESGKVTPADFDYSALRWDFGDAGRRALAGLAKSGNPKIAQNARDALAETERRYRWNTSVLASTRRDNLKVQSDDPVWTERIRDHFAAMPSVCSSPCIALDLGPLPDGTRDVRLVEGDTQVYVSTFNLNPDGADVPLQKQNGRAEPEPTNISGVKPNSKVEIREWRGRRIYVDGKPVGDPFE
jgi:hypothetical protein